MQVQYKQTLHEDDPGPNPWIIITVLLVFCGLFAGAVIGLIHLAKYFH